MNDDVLEALASIWRGDTTQEEPDKGGNLIKRGPTIKERMQAIELYCRIAEGEKREDEKREGGEDGEMTWFKAE